MKKLIADEAALIARRNQKTMRVQNWVFRRIKRSARRGNNATQTKRLINKTTEKELLKLGYLTTKFQRPYRLRIDWN